MFHLSCLILYFRVNHIKPRAFQCCILHYKYFSMLPIVLEILPRVNFNIFLRKITFKRNEYIISYNSEVYPVIEKILTLIYLTLINIYMIF